MQLHFQIEDSGGLTRVIPLFEFSKILPPSQNFCIIFFKAEKSSTKIVPSKVNNTGINASNTLGLYIFVCIQYFKTKSSNQSRSELPLWQQIIKIAVEKLSRRENVNLNQWEN